jgi:hypothetical protein
MPHETWQARRYDGGIEDFFGTFFSATRLL